DLDRGIRLAAELATLKANPLDAVPDDELISWCNQDAVGRYPAMATVITAFNHADEPGPRQWTSIAVRLLENCPDRIAVLKQFVLRLTPMSWRGSRATVMECNVRLLDDLEAYSEEAVVKFVAGEKLRLAQAIEAEHQNETAWSRERDERFE